MSASDLSRYARGGWLVLLAGLLLTTAALVGVHRAGGYYWAQVSVYFIVPADPLHENTATFTTDSVIATAGLVARLVDPENSGASTATDTTLVAEGVTSGSRVRLPNSGGQWSINYDRPVLDVQAAGSSAQAVLVEVTRLENAITGTLQRLQDEERVARANRITTTLSPSEVQVRDVRGDPKRAMVVTFLLGLGISAWSAVTWQRRRERIRLRQAKDGTTGNELPTPAVVGAR